MKQPVQQTQKKGRGFKYHFARSTYITVAWNWFMMFAAAACEAILTISVVYSCARLLPSLHTPLWLDNTVFIWQMVALDVGGLSLRKMANQAKKDGNESGALFAGRVSNALITIMVFNVVLSVLQGVAKLDPHIVAVVEGILLVARAVMAVLYAAVIHSLREDTDQEADQAPPALDAFDSWSLVALAAHLQSEYQQLADNHAKEIRDLHSHFADQLGEIKTEQGMMLATVQSVQDSIPSLDQTAIVQAVIEHFSEQFELAMQRLTKQHVTRISETLPPALPERLNKKQPRSAVNHKIVQLTPRENYQTAIYRLLDEDETRGPRELARLANCSPATAKTYRDLYMGTRNEQDGTAN